MTDPVEEHAIYNGFRRGDIAVRKGRRCRILAIQWETNPPSATVKMEDDGKEVNTEFYLLHRPTKYQDSKKDDKIICFAAGCHRVFNTERSLGVHVSKTKDKAHQKYRFERKSKKEKEKREKQKRKRKPSEMEAEERGIEPQTKNRKVDKLKWTVEDVAAWLACLDVKFCEYVPKFLEEKVSGELMDIADDDALACLVANPLHRKKIMLQWKKF